MVVGFEQMKKEAISRMKKLGLHENAVNEFEQKGQLNCSEELGALYWLKDDIQKYVEEYEKKSGNLVYHVIRSNTDFGLLYNMLLVGKNEENWKYENEILRENIVFAYVENIDDSCCSECGSIGIKKLMGGLVRVS